ncbi:MAG: T9SS type A sorting domain-containing protein [Bacteroidetes bacterium]|nr:T9SS type A sorting domain-containing protein [Bacteroidota bacterium]
MKINRYLYSVLLGLMLSHFSFGQCVPDTTNSNPGIYPDTLINLDTSFVGDNYEMVMTAIVPEDTMVFGSPIPIDSIGILKFEGLPAGFTVIANTSSAYWKGGSSGCILITGAPTITDVGVYPLTIQVIAVVAGTPAPYDVPGYRLVISGTSGFSDIESSPTTAFAFPNPFRDKINIQFTSPYSELCVFQVFNSKGSLIHSSNQQLDIGTNTILFNNVHFAEGLYFYSLSSEHLHMANKIFLKY